MSEQIKLKPCPFCGKDDAAFGKTTHDEHSRIAELNGTNVFHFVNCPWCGANNQGVLGWMNQAKAAGHWNTRASLGDAKERKA